MCFVVLNLITKMHIHTKNIQKEVKAPRWNKVEADSHGLLVATNSTTLMPWGWTEDVTHAPLTTAKSAGDYNYQHYKMHCAGREYNIKLPLSDCNSLQIVKIIF